ncbi:MAG: hypothetical protein ACREK5_02800 [Gemmatimonadota bacterium]
MLALASSIALVIPAAVCAQERVLGDPDAARISAEGLRTTPEIWVVRGEGTAAPIEHMEADLPPSELTRAQKSTLVASFGKIMLNLGPWRVTPGDPRVPDRVWLNFREVSDLATNTDPANTLGNASSYAIFNPPFDNHGVTLAFVPPALSRYLVDCRVKKLLASHWYRVRVYPSGAEQTFASTNHLLLVYDAVQMGYVSFSVQAEGPTQPTWQFYSCEVTPLQP